MTKTDELTKEVVEELKEMDANKYTELIDGWAKTHTLLAVNFGEMVKASPLLTLAVATDEMVTRVMQILMYLAYRVGESKGKGDMLEELVGGKDYNPVD